MVFDRWRQRRSVRRIMDQIDRHGYPTEPVGPGHPAWCACVQRMGHPPGVISNGMADADPVSQRLFAGYLDAQVRAYCPNR